MGRYEGRWRWAQLVLLAALVAVLAFPQALFPHPATNDAMGLANAEWPVLLLEVIGAVVVYVVFPGGLGTLVRAAVGVLLVGAAIALIVGLLVFGNMSNDRFGPLLVFPPVLGLVGLVGIVVAVALGAQHRSQLVRGAGYGLAMAFGFGAWTLVRGARDWLLAPYGLDLLILLAVLGAGLVMFLMSPRMNPRG